MANENMTMIGARQIVNELKLGSADSAKIIGERLSKLLTLDELKILMAAYDCGIDDLADRIFRTECLRKR